MGSHPKTPPKHRAPTNQRQAATVSKEAVRNTTALRREGHPFGHLASDTPWHKLFVWQCLSWGASNMQAGRKSSCISGVYQSEPYNVTQSCLIMINYIHRHVPLLCILSSSFTVHGSSLRPWPRHFGHLVIHSTYKRFEDLLLWEEQLVSPKLASSFMEGTHSFLKMRGAS